MNIGCALLGYIIFSSMIVAQNASKSSANIKVKLVDGVIFKINKSDLDFNFMQDASESVLKIQPKDGIILHVSAKKTSSVIINYTNIDVNKIVTVGYKTANQKTLEESLLFQPIIQRLNNVTNKNTVDLLNETAFSFGDEEKHSSLDLWIGAVVSLPNPPLEGMYLGTFTLSLVY
jgi:hypothetical protein